MRTIVNTTKQTTYVVTDRDIIEALVGLGIPRSVLFSEDTTIKMDKKTLGEKGFYFTDDENIDTFLTVEGAAVPVPTPAPVKEEKEEVYPNGTVLVGQYTGEEYTILGYAPANRKYTMRRQGYNDTFPSYWSDTHNERIYRVKTPAAAPTTAKKQEHPNGTVFIGKCTGSKYTVEGYDEKKDHYQIRHEGGAIYNESTNLLNLGYTLQPAPLKEEVYPVGTVLVGLFSGNEFVVLGYNEDRKEYTVRSKCGIETQSRIGFHGGLFKVKTPVGTATIQEEVYPVGTVLLRAGREYAVASYDTTTGVYVLNAVSGSGRVHVNRALVHDPKEYPLKPAAPAPVPDRLPVGSVVKFKNYNGAEDLLYITGYENKYGEGYRMWHANDGSDGRKTWDRYTVVHAAYDGRYTVVYKADPSKAAPTFKDAFPVGTVLKHTTGFVSVLTGYRENDFDGAVYTTYTSTWGEGFDYHYNLVSDRYTVLYNPSEQPEQSKT